MKATKQYFPVVPFIMLYKVFQLLSLWMKFQSDHSNETATERYFLMEVPQKGLSAAVYCAF